MPDITTGLVGYWQFDDGSGNTAVDSSASGLNGDLTGHAPTWVSPGFIGSSALSFAAASAQYVNFASPTTALKTAAMTIASWINPTSFPNAYGTIFSRLNTSYRQLFVTSTGKLAAYVFATADVHVDPANTVLIAGIPNHVGFTYDSSSGLITYVNGRPDGSAAANGAITLDDATAKFGSEPIQAGRDYNGIIDNGRYYNRALTAADMGELFSEGFKPAVNYQQYSGGMVGRLIV